MSKEILNLGCGTKIIKNAVNLDINKNVGADVIWDLNKYPYPLKDNRFKKILISHVLEHLNDIQKTLEEVHRVSQKGSLVYIELPHYTSPNAYTDYTHQHFFGYNSFNYFEDDDRLSFYTTKKFIIIRREIILPKSFFNIIPGLIAKSHPFFYENHLGWIFPAQELRFVLKVQK